MITDFKKYQSQANKILTHFCNKEFYSENDLAGYFNHLIAQQIGFLYDILSKSVFEEDLVVEKIEVPAFNTLNYVNHKDAVYLSPLKDIYDLVNIELKEYVIGFYIHGSLASMDYVLGWSDVDTFAIIREEVLHDSKKLLNLRRIFKEIINLMKRIDPLQHHGVILATEVDLKSYPEEFLPFEVLKRMVCMSGKANLNLKIRKLPSGFEHLKGILNFIIEAEKKGVFEHHAYKNEYLLSEFKNSENGMYQLKYYLGEFLLMPCHYLTAIGQSAYKKDSFDKVKDIFPKNVMKWIDKISELRTEWGIKEGHSYSPNKIPDWVQNKLGKEYFKESAKAAEELLAFINSQEKGND